jgi:hypothetical protein
MLISRRISPARRVVLALCAACLILAAFAPTVLAAEPPVTVRVEGLTETRLLPTQVTLTGAPVVKDGNPEHSCPGSSAVAALQLATAGNWSGPWNSKYNQYELFTIEGETHVFEPEAKANYFWSFWLNEKEAEVGACEAEVKPGDRVLFVLGCYGEACPEPAPTPLGIEAPSTANVGEPVSVTVKRFSRTGVATEVAGATITGAGAAVTTDSHGHATLAFTRSGASTLQVSAPESIRTEAVLCVHNGNDGTCGTPAPAGTTITQNGGSGVLGVTAAGPPYKGPYAIVARATGVRDGHVYSRRNAPRVLSGIVSAHTGISSVSIELRRRHGGRCSAYDGKRERFLPARCGHGSFFKVSSTSSFSYLLPLALARGEYVLDIEATDVVGNHTKLARGTSRVRFYVH